MVMFTCGRRDVGEEVERGNSPGRYCRKSVNGCGRRMPGRRHDPNSIGVAQRRGNEAFLREGLRNRFANLGFYLQRNAVRRRDAAQSAVPLARQAPQPWDWSIESGPELHWSYPAAVCSACEACGLPCSPTDRAGSGWTHEKVPQKPNRNALRITPCYLTCPAGTTWRRRCMRGTRVLFLVPRLTILPTELDALAG